MVISIHALIAESDIISPHSEPDSGNFYPRSPCGERLKNIKKPMQGFNFYPRSPCGERLKYSLGNPRKKPYFYPRSPCGERHLSNHQSVNYTLISIHALLAESDLHASLMQCLPPDFYPRSPCGERHNGNTNQRRQHSISIHALLAESDSCAFCHSQPLPRFLSTLSLRRATACPSPVWTG